MLMISKTVQGNKHNRTVVSRRIRRLSRARGIGLPALYIMLVCRIVKQNGYQEGAVTYPRGTAEMCREAVLVRKLGET